MKSIQQKFEKAYDKYAEGILRHIYFRVSDRNVAEDLTQETFFKAWRSIAAGQTGKIKNFKAFFYRIANNLIIDHYRGKKPVVSLEKMEEEQIEAKAVQPALQERKAELEIEKKELERHLAELKDEYKEVLVLRYIDDMSIKEVSEITGKTPNNVRVMIHRALNALRGKMSNSPNSPN